MSNVRPLRDAPSWFNRLGVCVAYLVFAWLVVTSPVGAIGNTLSLFMIVGLLTWAFIIRRRDLKYFVRFHTTQALMLNISLAAALWLLGALLDMLGTIPGLNILIGYVISLLFDPMGAWLPVPAVSVPALSWLLTISIKELLVMTLAIVLAIDCLRGEYTELPWITDGVRNWI